MGAHALLSATLSSQISDPPSKGGGGGGGGGGGELCFAPSMARGKFALLFPYMVRSNLQLSKSAFQGQANQSNAS